MKALLRFTLGLGIAAAAALSSAQATGPTQFYVVAHEDDWQLFMGSKGFSDISSFQPVVVICVTAGDAGYGNGPIARGVTPFYKARETAAIFSNNVPSSTIPLWFPGDVSSKISVNGHNITCVTHRNTDNWFLRLPDGNVDGNGTPINFFASLKRFRTGQIATFSPVDNSTHYKSYADLSRTVGAIMARYTPGTVNVTEIDHTLNPGGNSDHDESSLLAINNAGSSATGFRLWNDYSTAGLPEKSSDLLQNKSLMLGALTASLSQQGWALYLDDAHRSYSYNEVFREVPAGTAFKK